MACTTYLITTRCSYSWNKRWGHIIYLVARNQIISKRRTIYIVNGGYYFLIQIISSLLILESPKFSLGMTLPFSRAEKPAQGWNSLCHMNLAMLQDRPFLCMAILMDLNLRNSLLQLTFRFTWPAWLQ